MLRWRHRSADPLGSRQPRSGLGAAEVTSFLLWCVALVGCGTPEAKAPDARVRRDTRIVHEACEVTGKGAVDVDGDGAMDVQQQLAGGRVRCRGLDLDLDGAIDVWVYHGPDGTVRRRESDFDRDGGIDEIATYQGGQLNARQYATHLAGRLDTWEFYEGGVLVRTERDSNGDAIIDQWWEYPRAPQDCPLVHSDVDGDGRPDPGATVDLCELEGADGVGKEASR